MHNHCKVVLQTKKYIYFNWSFVNNQVSEHFMAKLFTHKNIGISWETTKINLNVLLMWHKEFIRNTSFISENKSFTKHTIFKTFMGFWNTKNNYYVIFSCFSNFSCLGNSFCLLDKIWKCKIWKSEIHKKKIE